MKPWRIATIGTALAAAAAIIMMAGRRDQSAVADSAGRPAARPITLPAEPGTYLEAYAPDVPDSYANVAALTNDPILIAETGAAAGAKQPAMITDLFAGIRSYQVLGLIWFDAVGREDWRLISAPAIAAFRQGAEAYHRVQS